MINLSGRKFLKILSITVFMFGLFSVANGQFSILEQNRSGQNVDFFIDWSARTFVPADYLGKPLPTFDSIISLNATPIGNADKKIVESNYTFNWIIDGATALKTTGSLAEFYAGEGAGSEHAIQLRVFDKNKDIVNEYHFSIPISKPDITLYRETGTGALETVSGMIIVNPGSELNIIAEPFFFNHISSENDLTYSWELNGETIKKDSVDKHKISIVFPQEIPSKTPYELNLRVENPSDQFQSLRKTYKILVQ